MRPTSTASAPPMGLSVTPAPDEAWSVLGDRTSTPFSTALGPGVYQEQEMMANKKHSSREGVYRGGLRTKFLIPDNELDEETLRTRRYWQRWGKKAARELVRSAREQDYNDHIQTPELLVTARCPTRQTIHRSSSTESIQTGISLLSTSTIEKKRSSKRSSKKEKKKDENKVHEEEKKVNWEVYARMRRGGQLDKMMGGGEQIQDLMSPDERVMLHYAGFSKGLRGLHKAGSTANLLSVNKSKEETTPSRTASRRSRKMSRKESVFRRPVQSPKTIIRSLQKSEDPRPESAAGSFTKHLEDPTISSRCSSSFSRDYSTKTPYRAKSTMSGMPPGEMDGLVSKRIKHKLNRTISALNRMTGYGDSRDVVLQTVDEKGVWTDKDYARHPRYPQNIRICPQLSKVIREETRLTMGRPKQKQLSRRDLQILDRHSPTLDRTHRNLLIFDWLNDIDGEFDVNKVPEIKDLEGHEPIDGPRPKVYTDVTMTPQDYGKLCMTGRLSTFLMSAMEDYGSEGSEQFSVSSQEGKDSDDEDYVI